MEEGPYSSDSENEMPSAPQEPIPEVVYPVNVEVEVPQTDGKLFKTVLVEGTGLKPTYGSKVSVHYVGTLASDGSKFDSSRDRGEMFEFTLGKGEVIKGWDSGVATMRKGEKCVLKCLPEYAYGAGGSPPKIPPNSILNFEVELFDFYKSEDISENKDKSLMKSITVEGSGWERPDYEASVKCSIAVLQDSSPEAAVLDHCEDVAFVIGEVDLIPGLEQTLKSMKKGEVCTVNIAGSIVGEPPAGALLAGHVIKGKPLTLRIELKDFEKVKTWDVKGKQKVEEGLKRKNQGNEYFAKKDYERARAKYKRCLEFIEHEYGLEDADKDDAKKIRLAAWTNMALVCLHLSDQKECISLCTKVLDVDAKNVKALFRRGKAHNQLENWEEAKADLTAALAIEPGNADATRELELVSTKIRKHMEKQKKVFGGLFQKLSAMEEKEKAKAAAEAPPAPAPAEVKEPSEVPPAEVPPEGDVPPPL